VFKALEESIRHIDVTLALDGTFFGATVSDTMYGNCGGSVPFTINYNEVTGDFTGTFSFNSYCEDDITISGNTSVSGNIDLITLEIYHYYHISFSFSSLQFTFDNDSFTLAGTIDYDDFSANPVTGNIDVKLRDDSTGVVYWTNDYSYSIEEYANYVEVEVFSGRYYDPEYGYVNISYTTTPFLTYDGDKWPSDGVLIIEGDTGIGGGSTMASLTANPSGTYEVDADTNGDGTYDWSSGPIPWE